MNKVQDRWIEQRRDFHRYPELGFNEECTKKKVASILQSFNIEVYEGVGVVGVLDAGNANKTIALRADMDALPITEISTHDYVSQNAGVMHACGHDGHMTMLLAAAERLAIQQIFDGRVVLIFQPNEEHGLGARAMLDEGLLTQFSIDEVYAIHNLPGAPLGQVSTRVGQICASESLFEIDIVGQGGHASMPHVGVDAITVAAQMVQALQTIVSRKLPPSAGSVVSVTEIITDGQRNVLPGNALLKGDVRARLPEHRLLIEKYMRQIVDGVAMAHNVQVTMQFNTEFIETINAQIPTEAVIRASQQAGLSTIANRDPMSFSEDFAHFSAAVPGCLFLLGNGEYGVNGQPLHAADYDFNDDLIAIGANLWTVLVQDRLPCVGSR